MKKIITKITGIKLILILNICFILLLQVNLKAAKTIFHKAGWYSVSINGGYESASSYFDINENKVLQIYDSAAPAAQSVKDYSFDYTRYYLGLKMEYAIMSDLTTYFDMPVSKYSLLQTYLTNDSNIRLKKRDDYLTKIDYFGLGAKYLLHSAKSYSALNMEFRIPSGFHNGIYNDSNYKFLSDGAFEFYGGLITGIDFSNSWIETEITYNYRAEDLKNQLLIHAEAGISTIPETQLFGLVDFVQSLSSFKNAILFNPQKTISQENYLSLGFGFSIFFSKNLFAELQYKARILGKNSWASSNFYITTGYAIK